MPLIITKTPISTFPSILGDDYLDLDEIEEKNYFPSVTEGGDFEIDIKFEYVDEFEVPVPIVSANVITDTSVYGLNITKTGEDTFKLKGSYSNVITDAYYLFVMRDGSVKQLPPDTTEDFKAIIQYKMPAQTFTTKEIEWALEFSGNVTENPIMTQYVYWVFSSAANNLKSLVASRP